MSFLDELFKKELNNANKSSSEVAIINFNLWRSTVSEEDKIKYLILSAKEGHHVAQYNLGIAYYEGDNVPQDYNEAVKWWKLSADQGNSQSQRSLAVCYRYGIGVEIDNQKYLDYLQDSAINRHPMALFTFGMEFYTGTLIDQNQALGLELIKDAANSGFDQAISFIKDLNKSTSTDNFEKKSDRWKILDQRLSELDIKPLLVMNKGKVIHLSEIMLKKNKDWIGEDIFEVMIKINDSDPFFVYYESDLYTNHLIMASSLSGNTLEVEEYIEYHKDNASEFLGMYVLYVLMDMIGDDDLYQRQFNHFHNKQKTNKIIYLHKLNGWYPIQQTSAESRNDFDSKIRGILSGDLSLANYIALDNPSPSNPYE